MPDYYKKPYAYAQYKERYGGGGSAVGHGDKIGHDASSSHEHEAAHEAN
jgi:hypothetical protein